ncbi:hypothetical protein Sjap_009611 [Stephania japonica]|uniref:Uncharacterized protein n=1 Tax=Stephania japonica TaxID=461633 RepID=A0AAP0J817_9MAGN
MFWFLRSPSDSDTGGESCARASRHPALTRNDWLPVKGNMPRFGCRLAAHGPVTAVGAQSLGVSNFASFDGVLDALLLHWADG